MDKRIEPGHCWISGEPVFEVLVRYGAEHPMAGRVQRLGPPLPCMKEISVILASGRHITLRVHEDHIEELDFKELWTALVAAELDNREQRKLEFGYNEELVELSHRNQLKILAYPPIGVL